MTARSVLSWKEPARVLVGYLQRAEQEDERCVADDVHVGVLCVVCCVLCVVCCVLCVVCCVLCVVCCVLCVVSWALGVGRCFNCGLECYVAL
jgi:hypothetical protein